MDGFKSPALLKQSVNFKTVAQNLTYQLRPIKTTKILHFHANIFLCNQSGR